MKTGTGLLLLAFAAVGVYAYRKSVANGTTPPPPPPNTTTTTTPPVVTTVDPNAPTQEQVNTEAQWTFIQNYNPGNYVSWFSTPNSTNNPWGTQGGQPGGGLLLPF